MDESRISPSGDHDAELQMLARLIQNSPGMAYRCLHDADWTLEFVSSGSVQLLGYTPEQLVRDRVATITDLTHPDDLAKVSLAVETALSSRLAFQIVYRMRNASGTYRWVSESGRGVFDEAGNLEALEGFLTDITAHVESENSLRQAQRRDTISRMASGIAHDFNNLLSVVQGSTEFIREGLPLGNELLHHVAAIEDATERATALTTRLLDFGRPRNIDTAPIDLVTVVRGLEDLLRSAVGANHKIALALPDAAVICRIDPTALEQIIVNLAINAREAMAAGGGLRIAVEADESASVASVSVCDDGEGIPSEQLAMIFEPYFTTKGKTGGAGLGLTMVRSIVEGAEGSIHVESGIGEGTCFRIEFPLLNSTAADQSSDGGVFGTEVILFAEDDESVRSIMVRGLRRHGFTVLEAADGHQALHISERHKGPIDLVLTDAKMPRLNGIGLVERLRDQRPSLPAILISGDNVVAPDGLFDLNLRKPLGIEELSRHVRQILDRDVR
jgi:two-component system cell cycle sensor histidine kinase/response regulator CckA